MHSSDKSLLSIKHDALQFTVKHPGGTPDNSACVGIRWSAISMEFTVELISSVVQEASAKFGNTEETVIPTEQSAPKEQNITNADGQTVTKANLVDALQVQGESAKEFVHEVYPRTLKQYNTTFVMKMAFKGGLAFWSGSAADFLQQVPFSYLKEVHDYVVKVRKAIALCNHRCHCHYVSIKYSFLMRAWFIEGMNFKPNFIASFTSLTAP